MTRIRLALVFYFFMVAHKGTGPVDSILEVYEDVVEVLLVLEILLTEDS